MAQGPGRQRLGLLACAFDATGREILDALAVHPGLPGSHVHSYHVDEPDGGSPAAWFRRTPAGEWSPAPWPSSSAKLGDGLVAAVQNALDASRWQTRDGGMDLLNLVLLNPVSGDRPFGELPADVVATLRLLRRRFRKIGRVLLLVDGRFEPFGEGAPPGILEPLPLAGGADGNVFDLIVLLDRVDIEGKVINDAGKAREKAAGILFHLTLGELAPVLYQQIQREQARLGEPGRYVALGIAEWRLTRDRGIEAVSGLLYRQLAGRLLDANGASAGDGPPGVDPWTEEVDEELLREPQRSQPFPQDDPTAMADQFDERGWETVRTTLRSAGWNLHRLEPFLRQRLAALESLANRATLKLAAFMDPRFAKWFVEKSLGKLKGTPDSDYFGTEPLTGKKAACVLLALGFVAGVGVAVGSEYTLLGSVAAAACGLGAVLLAVTGFERKISRPVPGSPPPDEMPELTYRRNRSWIAASLADRCRRQLTSWKDSRERLRQDAESPPMEHEPAFPFHPEVCALLLQERGIDAAAVLQRFWQDEPTALEAAVGRTEPTLPVLLREYARRSCEPFAELEWSDVFRAIGGEQGLENPAWRESLEQARAEALPWLPVAGSSLQTILAIPGRLPADLRSAFSRQFPGHKTVEEIEGGEIMVLQLSQGYRLPTKD